MVTVTLFFSGFFKLLVYFIIAASSILISRKLFEAPKELYRKMLHFVLLGSAPVFLYLFHSWQSSVFASIIFAIIAYPALALAEHWEGYANLLAERNAGEIKRSLIIVFLMFAGVITICWGILDAKYLALAVVFGWGFGDATAALVGKKYGRHYIEGRFVDGKKTIEGTLGMFVVSFITIAIILLANTGLPWQIQVLIAAITAAIVAIVELYTKNGLDTVTCPAAILLVMIPLLYFWS